MSWVETRTAGLARRGPFRLLRDVPQVGFLLVAAVLAGDLAVVGQRVGNDGTGSSAGTGSGSDAGAAAPQGSVEHDVFGSPETGPTPGENPDDYVAERRTELALRVAGEPTRQAVAVVSFRAALSQAGLAAQLPGVRLAGVFVRKQIPKQITPAGYLPAADAGAALTTALRAVVASLATDEKNNLSQAATVTHLDIPVNLEQKQAFQQEADNEKTTIAAITGGGQFLYGAVVTGTYAQLGALAHGRQVRLVDPADDGVTAATIVPHALAPDDTTTVASLETIEGLKAP